MTEKDKTTLLIQKAKDLYGFASSEGIKLKDVVERANKKLVKIHGEDGAITYKGVVNRLAHLRKGRFASISDETINVLQESAIELYNEKLQPQTS